MASNPQDAIRETVNSAIGQLLSNLEPQINKFAADFASSAVDRSRDLAKSAVAATRRQPWLLVGTAAVLLVSAAAVFGVQNRRALAAGSSAQGA